MCSQPNIQVLEADTCMYECLQFRFSPLTVNITWCSLFQAVMKNKQWNTALSSLTFSSSVFPPDLLFLSSSPVPTFFFHTSVCIFFFSAVKCLQSTSLTLCYEAPLLPATKVANVNDGRCYSDTISGVWGLFLPIRSVKSFFLRYQCLSCHH